MSLIVCYKCLGSGKQLRKPERKCKVCSGMGQLSNRFFSESKKIIQKIMEKEMQTMVEVTIRNSFMKHSLQSSQTSLVRHEGVMCANCKVSPIVGFRFMCP